MLAEVLQGFSSERDFNQAKNVLLSLHQVDIAGTEIAIQAARNFRTLRLNGVTVRKTIDVLIATRCIEGGLCCSSAATAALTLSKSTLTSRVVR